jgi:signal peptidase I
LKDRRSKTKRQFFDPRYVGRENRRSHRLAFILVWSVLLYFVFQKHVVSLGIVSEYSMQPLLNDGDTFLVNKYAYHFGRPQRLDIVVLARSLYIEGQFVKRVVGMPGETVNIRLGRVYIDGKLLDEPYAIGDTFPDHAPLLIGPEEYFVLGDNRMVSEDSRQFGCVPRRNIEGRIRPGKLFSF